MPSIRRGGKPVKRSRLIAFALPIAAAVVGGAFLAPTSAYAAQNNSIGGTVYTSGAWTPGGVTRHKTDTGNIKIKITDNTDGGICLRLRSTKNNAIFGSACWAAGNYDAKVISTDVLAGTVFVIDAHKRINGGSNNQWAGIANY
jgi:hypothetical protein